MERKQYPPNLGRFKKTMLVGYVDAIGIKHPPTGQARLLHEERENIANLGFVYSVHSSYRLYALLRI